MKKINIRLIIQIIFFAIITMFAVNHGLSESGKAFLPEISLHAICPFGGVETFLSLVTMGVLVKKVQLASVVLMIIVIAITIILGPVFCGWVCPLGSYQEWIGKLGKKIFKKKYNTIIPKKADNILRYLRYGVLIFITIATFKSLTLVFSDFDPYYTLFNFWTGEVAVGGVIILIVTTVLSLFVERPWCKYLCPYGALLGLFNLFRIFKIRRNEKTCIDCGLCTKSCPMNITIHDKKKILNHQCISCLECTSENACPVDNTVTLQAFVRGEKNEN